MRPVEAAFGDVAVTITSTPLPGGVSIPPAPSTCACFVLGTRWDGQAVLAPVPAVARALMDAGAVGFGAAAASKAATTYEWWERAVDGLFLASIDALAPIVTSTLPASVVQAAAELEAAVTRTSRSKDAPDPSCAVQSPVWAQRIAASALTPLRVDAAGAYFDDCAAPLRPFQAHHAARAGAGADGDGDADADAWAGDRRSRDRSDSDRGGESDSDARSSRSDDWSDDDADDAGAGPGASAPSAGSATSELLGDPAAVLSGLVSLSPGHIGAQDRELYLREALPAVVSAIGALASHGPAVAGGLLRHRALFDVVDLVVRAGLPIDFTSLRAAGRAPSAGDAEASDPWARYGASEAAVAQADSARYAGVQHLRSWGALTDASTLTAWYLAEPVMRLSVNQLPAGTRSARKRGSDAESRTGGTGGSLDPASERDAIVANNRIDVVNRARNAWVPVMVRFVRSALPLLDASAAVAADAENARLDDVTEASLVAPGGELYVGRDGAIGGNAATASPKARRRGHGRSAAVGAARHAAVDDYGQSPEAAAAAAAAQAAADKAREDRRAMRAKRRRAYRYAGDSDDDVDTGKDGDGSPDSTGDGGRSPVSPGLLDSSVEGPADTLTSDAVALTPTLSSADTETLESLLIASCGLASALALDPEGAKVLDSAKGVSLMLALCEVVRARLARKSGGARRASQAGAGAGRGLSGLGTSAGGMPRASALTAPAAGDGRDDDRLEWWRFSPRPHFVPVPRRFRLIAVLETAMLTLQRILFWKPCHLPPMRTLARLMRLRVDDPRGEKGATARAMAAMAAGAAPSALGSPRPLTPGAATVTSGSLRPPSGGAGANSSGGAKSGGGSRAHEAASTPSRAARAGSGGAGSGGRHRGNGHALGASASSPALSPLPSAAAGAAMATASGSGSRRLGASLRGPKAAAGAAGTAPHATPPRSPLTPVRVGAVQARPASSSSARSGSLSSGGSDGGTGPSDAGMPRSSASEGGASPVMTGGGTGGGGGGNSGVGVGVYGSRAGPASGAAAPMTDPSVAALDACTLRVSMTRLTCVRNFLIKGAAGQLSPDTRTALARKLSARLLRLPLPSVGELARLVPAVQATRLTADTMPPLLALLHHGVAAAYSPARAGSAMAAFEPLAGGRGSPRYGAADASSSRRALSLTNGRRGGSSGEGSGSPLGPSALIDRPTWAHGGSDGSQRVGGGVHGRAGGGNGGDEGLGAGRGCWVQASALLPLPLPEVGGSDADEDDEEVDDEADAETDEVLADDGKSEADEGAGVEEPAAPVHDGGTADEEEDGPLPLVGFVGPGGGGGVPASQAALQRKAKEKAVAKRAAARAEQARAEAAAKARRAKQASSRIGGGYKVAKKPVDDAAAGDDAAVDASVRAEDAGGRAVADGAHGDDADGVGDSKVEDSGADGTATGKAATEDARVALVPVSAAAATLPSGSARAAMPLIAPPALAKEPDAAPKWLAALLASAPSNGEDKCADDVLRGPWTVLAHLLSFQWRCDDTVAVGASAADSGGHGNVRGRALSGNSGRGGGSVRRASLVVSEAGGLWGSSERGSAAAHAPLDVGRTADHALVPHAAGASVGLGYNGAGGSGRVADGGARGRGGDGLVTRQDDEDYDSAPELTVGQHGRDAEGKGSDAGFGGAGAASDDEDDDMDDDVDEDDDGSDDAAATGDGKDDAEEGSDSDGRRRRRRREAARHRPRNVHRSTLTFLDAPMSHRPSFASVQLMVTRDLIRKFKLSPTWLFTMYDARFTSTAYAVSEAVLRLVRLAALKAARSGGGGVDAKARAAARSVCVTEADVEAAAAKHLTSIGAFGLVRDAMHAVRWAEPRGAAGGAGAVAVSAASLPSSSSSSSPTRGKAGGGAAAGKARSPPGSPSPSPTPPPALSSAPPPPGGGALGERGASPLPLPPAVQAARAEAAAADVALSHPAVAASAAACLVFPVQSARVSQRARGMLRRSDLTALVALLAGVGAAVSGGNARGGASAGVGAVVALRTLHELSHLAQGDAARSRAREQAKRLRDSVPKQANGDPVVSEAAAAALQSAESLELAHSTLALADVFVAFGPPSRGGDGGASGASGGGGGRASAISPDAFYAAIAPVGSQLRAAIDAAASTSAPAARARLLSAADLRAASELMSAIMSAEAPATAARRLGGR